MQTNTIYTWQNNLKTKLVSMNNIGGNPNYLPEENARNLARLLMGSMPGNTNDILFDKIANDIKLIVKNNPQILLEDFDIQNRIRIALDEIANLE